jgi:flagellar basal body rod protein FlgC
MFRFYLDQKKQAKIQWIKDPSHSNIANLNSVRCEACRHFRNKKKPYLKTKIEEREPNSKIQNIWVFYRGVIHFKKVSILGLI